MFRAGVAVVGAAMFLSGGVASAATTITDPAGDANGGANAGLDVATGPASDAARDLTKVVVSSDDTALTVAFTTSAPVDQGATNTLVRLNVTTPKCPVALGVWIGGTDSNNAPAYLPHADSYDCGGYISNEGYSLTSSGSTLSLRFPYAALARWGVPITASTALTHLKADTFEGTMAYSVGGCSGDPTICTVFGADNFRA